MDELFPVQTHKWRAVLALTLTSEASTWFGPWSHKLKGQNDEMYTKLSIVFITLITMKLVISQIHLKCEWL